MKDVKNTDIELITIENDKQNKLVVSSRIIAKRLGKRHAHVIRDIENIILNSTTQIWGELTNGDFHSPNNSTNPNLGSLIILNNYVDKKGEKRKEYLLTKDGFILYMFNIQGHIEFKMAYINEFNRMENELNKELKKERKNLSPSEMNLKIKYYDSKSRLLNTIDKLLSNEKITEKHTELLLEDMENILTNNDNLLTSVKEKEDNVLVEEITKFLVRHNVENMPNHEVYETFISETGIKVSQNKFTREIIKLGYGVVVKSINKKTTRIIVKNSQNKFIN